MKGTERAFASKKGEVFRLEGKLGRALAEVAREKEAACSARAQIIKLKNKLIEEEQAADEEKQRLRSLKNKMASEKRDAQRLASSAYQMQARLSETRDRLRALRKEVNATRVQLNFYEMTSDDDSADDAEQPDEPADEESFGKVHRLDAPARPRCMTCVHTRMGIGPKRIQWTVRPCCCRIL